MIHRDLKPSNIMAGSYGEVQVLDWGLAKVLPQGGVADESPDRGEQPDLSVIRTVRTGSDADASRPGSFLGTPAYTAPEQANGEVESVDERADVFGLGSILCEILTGKPAYTGPSGEAIKRKAKRGETADALRRLEACGADAELTGLARDCLAVEPDERPRNAGEIVRRLTAYLAGVQERLRAAELARAAEAARAEEAQATAAAAEKARAAEEARAEEEARGRVLADRLAGEAEARAAAERKRRRMTVALAASVLALTVLSGISSSYWAQQRQTQAARVMLALNEATLLRDQAAASPDHVSKWEAAAKGVEAAGNALAEIREPQPAIRLMALRNEVQSGLLAARRDQILLDALAHVRTSKQDLGTSGADAAYARAFREAGLDVDALPPAEIGAALKARPESVAEAAAAALDDWALVRWRGSHSGPTLRRLLVGARAADPNPFRDRVRTALLALDRKAHEAALRTLAGDPKAAELPPPSAVLLAAALRSLNAVEPAVPCSVAWSYVIRTTFWVNYELAIALRLSPNGREEAVRYYSAARALRPETTHALAHRLEEMGRGDEALELFADLAARRPDDLENLVCYGHCLKERGRREVGAVLEKAVATGRRRVRIAPDDATAHFGLGSALRARGSLEEAIAEYRTAIRVNPDDALPHVALGGTLDDQGKLDAAIAEYRAAIRLAPDLAPAHHNLGKCLRDQRKLEEAVAEYRTAIRLSSDLAAHHYGLGNALKDQGKLDEAIAEYHTAIRLKPDDANAHDGLGWALSGQGKLDAAIAEYREAIRLNPDDAYAHNSLGIALSDQGKLEEAIAEYRESIRFKPDDHWPHNNLGNALKDQGKLDEAIAEYHTAIRLKPDDATAQNGLGNALKDQGKLDEAIAAYHTAIRLKPDDATAQNGLGNALKDQGKLDEAIAAYHTAIRLKPDDATAQNGLGNALKDQGKLDEAIAAYHTAIRLKPGDHEPHENLGTTLNALGKFEEAIAELRASVQLGSGCASAHNSLGNALKDQGKLNEAISEYRIAICLKPDYAFAHTNLGLALQDQGKLDQAIAEYRTAMRLKPDDAAPHVGLGNALKDQGKLDQAVAEYQTAIRLKPDLSNAHNGLGWALNGQGKLDAAIAEYREAIRLKADSPWPHHNLGNALTQQGRIEEAIAEYRTAIRLKPDEGTAHNNLAVVLANHPDPRRREPAAALVHSNRAVELGPKQGNFFGTLGLVEYRLGHWQPAQAAIERKMKLHRGGDAYDWLILALVDAKQGRKDQARALFDKSLEWIKKHDARDPDLRLFWSEAADLLGQPGPDATAAALAMRLPAVLKGEDRPRDAVRTAGLRASGL